MADEPRRLLALDGPLIRWGGAGILAISLGFIGHRLWTLDPAQLVHLGSWSLAGSVITATALSAGANHALAQGWRKLADPGGHLSARVAGRIYGRGVLLKYLPGGVFQYVSRQIEGRGAGIAHATMAKASMVEIGLHIASSMTVAAGCLAAHLAGAVPAGLALGLIGVAAWRSGRPIGRAFACQLVAFSCFAASAMLVAAALLPAGLSAAQFAALYLLAWLAGFVVPVAPGGLGVREAALLALAAGSGTAAQLLGCVVALRIASLIGDVGYGLFVLWRNGRA